MRKRPDDDGVIIHEYLWHDEFIEGGEDEELEDLIEELDIDEGNKDE